MKTFRKPLPVVLGLGLLATSCDRAAGALDSALLGGDAHAAVAPIPGDLWRERAPNDALPAGVVPMSSLAPLMKAIKPGVVNVYTTSVSRAFPFGRQGPQGYPDPFEDFFRRFGQPHEESRRQSLGSGFIVNPKGLVITNNHVVENATEIRVKLADAREFEAEIVGRDSRTDVALLQLKPGGGDLGDLPVVYLGDSDRLEVGDFVIASGNPFGLDHSVSLGIVSAKERVIGAGPYDDFIQTDAAINPGNSGGPLLNTRGEVVGVNTAIVGQGIGFAVPINMVKALLPQLVAKGKIVRGWLGVSIQDVTPELAKTLKLERAKGALVAGVMKKSPAEAGGLKAGDVVVGLNGKPVETYNQLSREVAFLAPGTSAQLAVLRDGKTRTVELKIGQRPEDDDAPPAEDDDKGSPVTSDLLGITVQPLNPQRAARLGVDAGVQIATVKPDSPAARAGARPGDVILELQRQPVRSLKDYQDGLAAVKPGQNALLLLQRQNASIYVAVRVPK